MVLTCLVYDKQPTVRFYIEVRKINHDFLGFSGTSKNVEEVKQTCERMLPMIQKMAKVAFNEAGLKE